MIILFSSFTSNLFAKTDSLHFKKNAIYLESYGSAIPYSINYDRLLHNKGKLAAFSFRLGFAYLFVPSFNSTYYEAILIPISSSILFGKKIDKIEIGISATYHSGHGYTPNNYTSYGFILGGRHQNSNKKDILFRLCYTPQIARYPKGYGITGVKYFDGSEWGFKNFAGFSIGFTF